MIIFILLASLIGTAVIGGETERVSYQGYKVYRLVPQNEGQLQFLKSLEQKGVIFWKDCSFLGRSCDVFLSPKDQLRYLSIIHELEIAITVFVDYIQSLVEENGISNPGAGEGRLTWDSYYGVDDIHSFIEQQASNYSSIASVINIGQSYEGRDLKLIKIGKRPGKKPAIFVEANAHAREWITNAVTTYLINDLLTTEDEDVKGWTEDFDFYILPVFNPDGLEYTRTNDRMWRKNRSGPVGAICKGVDLNRNFDYNWGGPGSSTNPCADTYCGSGPNSEPETAALTNFVQSISDDIVFYLSVHSYSQFIMFPYGDGIDESIYDSHMEIASKAAEAARVRHGTIFTPGNWNEILYPSTGDSMDWAKSKVDVNVSLTYELRDTGRYGFLLPAAQIRPSCEEFIDSLKPIVESLRNGIL